MQPVCEDYFKDIRAPTAQGSMYLNEPVRAYLDTVGEYVLGLHDGGVAARTVMQEHSELMDRLVRRLFRLAEDQYFADSPRLNFRIAVIAVGGYGRSELSLASDIDLLFLYKGKINPYVEIVTETISQRLWDARLTVGAATRNLRECMRIGRDDLPTMTSYLDARFLVGDPELFAELNESVRDYLRKNRKSFSEAKLEEQRERHEGTGESLYLLQPNVRESVGGLRDYHTARWLARSAQWEVESIEDLRLHAFIEPDEFDELIEALEFIWRIRNELHRKGRKDDRLHYDAQMRLAEQLNFPGEAPIDRAEKLMERYYRHARTVDRLSRLAVEHAISLSSEKKRRWRSAPYSVEEGLVISDGQLEIPSAEIITSDPLRLLSVFRIAQHHDVDLSSRSLRMLRQHVHLIDEEFQRNPEARDLFLDVLRSPTRVYQSLRLMNETGILSAYMPEFEHLVGLWQQDMYHTYTVDVHSLFLVEQLRRLGRGRFRDELELATQLIRDIKDPAPLYLGSLLHDIGKGFGGGHSQRGADMFPALAERMQLDENDAELAKLVIRHHLTMSQMAEQRDVHDPRQILKLANIVQTREKLRALYLSTIADIRSVSPEAWTSWKGGLIEALYRNTMEWLEVGEDQAAEHFLQRAVAEVADTEKKVREHARGFGVEEERIERYLQAMPRRYFFQHAPSEIAWHLVEAIRFWQSGEQISVSQFSPEGNERFWGLVIFARDQRGIFSTVTGVLSGCGHDTLAAHAYTARDRLAIDIFEVDPIAGGEAERETERERIEAYLRDIVAGRRDIASLVGGSRPLPETAARRIDPRVRISNEESDFYTVIDVTTDDRRALLFDMTRTLFQLGLDLTTSRVRTRAYRATDAFFVKQYDQKITSESRLAEIEQALLKAIHRGAD